MQPELLSVSENVSLNIVTSYVLSQSVTQIETGATYQLSFEADIASGVLEAYQGTQLVFISSRNTIFENERIFVTDVVFIYRQTPIDTNESIGVSESMSLLIS